MKAVVPPLEVCHSQDGGLQCRLRWWAPQFLDGESDGQPALSGSFTHQFIQQAPGASSEAPKGVGRRFPRGGCSLTRGANCTPRISSQVPKAVCPNTLTPLLLTNPSCISCPGLSQPPPAPGTQSKPRTPGQLSTSSAQSLPGCPYQTDSSALP